MLNNIFVVRIPVLPPGKNKTYGCGRGKGQKGKPRVYLTTEAKKWVKDASLIIGAKKGICEWEHTFDYYTLDIIFSAVSRLDVDAPIALIQDTLTRKLGFDDKLIIRTTCEKVEGEEGIYLTLKGFNYYELE